MTRRAEFRETGEPPETIRVARAVTYASKRGTAS
jgi:hypothetical protein